MELNVIESYRLLDLHGCYVSDVCDKCGQLLGPVRYTRMGESGMWCSRACRDGHDAHAPGTCWSCGASLAGLRRGTRFCSDTCRKRENRRVHDGDETEKSQITEISRDEQLKTQDLQARVGVLAIPAPSGPENDSLNGSAGVNTCHVPV